MESFIADAIDDDADLICVDALYDLAVKTLAISIPLVYQGKQLEWKSCIPCSSKEEAWEKWKDLRETMKTICAKHRRGCRTRRSGKGNGEGKVNKHGVLTEPIMTFGLACDMKKGSDNKGKLKKNIVTGEEIDDTDNRAKCTQEQFDASGIQGKVIHALNLTPQMIAVIGLFPPGSFMWSLARPGRTSGTRATATRKIAKGVRPYLSQCVNAEEAAIELLSTEMFAIGTAERENLRNKINIAMFPATIPQTAPMAKGVAAEKLVMEDKDIKKSTLDILKQKYTCSTKFNGRGSPAPALLSDDIILQGDLPISFHAIYPDTMVASLDFDFNRDCIVEFKHGILFGLDKLPAVSRGRNRQVTGTTADGKRTKKYEAIGWKKYIDQVQHQMLVKGYSKAMLLLTDPQWRKYVVDMVADPEWQRETIFAANLVSALSKLLISKQYNSFAEGGIGVSIPSLANCSLSSRGTAVAASAKPERETSTQYTCGCDFGFSGRFFDKEKYDKVLNRGGGEAKESYKMMSNFTADDVKESGMYITKINPIHNGCIPIDKAEQQLRGSKKSVEEISKELCIDTQSYGIDTKAARAKLHGEEDIYIPRGKARNLVQKADRDLERDKSEVTDALELTDHDKMLRVLTRDPNVHYLIQLEERDIDTEKVHRKVTILKVGQTQLEAKSGTAYVPKRVLLDESINTKGPEFFKNWSIHGHVTGSAAFPYIDADREDKVDEALETKHENSEFRLVSLAYSTTDELIDGARYPEQIGYDTTFNTNKYDYKLAFATGANASQKNINLLGTIINREKKENFRFVWNVALPLFYGTQTLSFVHLVTSDGDSTLIDVIDKAILSGCFPNAFRRRCYWHLVVKKFDKIYKPAKQRDLAVGPTLLKCVKKTIYFTECPQEFQQTWDGIQKWLKEVPSEAGTFEESDRTLLQTFLSEVYSDRERVAEAYTEKPMLQFTRTNNRNEGEHYAVKCAYEFTNMTKLVDLIRAERRRITERYLERDHIAQRKMRKTPFRALNLNLKKQAELLNILNDYAQGKVTEARKDSFNYSCEVLSGSPAEGLRILVTWNETALENPSLTKKLPINISPKLKPRIVTVVVDSKGQLILQCDCREFLNNQITCAHHQCINDRNLSKADVHTRYWKAYAIGRFDHTLSKRKLSSFRVLGAVLHAKNALGLKAEDIKAQCISLKSFLDAQRVAQKTHNPVYGRIHSVGTLTTESVNTDIDYPMDTPMPMDASGNTETGAGERETQRAGTVMDIDASHIINTTAMEHDWMVAVRSTARSDMLEYGSEIKSDANHLKNRKRLIKLMTEVVDSCRGETALMRSLARFVPVIIKRNAQLRNVLDSGKRKPHTGGIADKHFNTGKPSRTRLKGHGEKAPGKSTKKRKRLVVTSTTSAPGLNEAVASAVSVNLSSVKGAGSRSKRRKK